jgi:hypothetical protein
MGEVGEPGRLPGGAAELVDNIGLAAGGHVLHSMGSKYLDFWLKRHLPQWIHQSVYIGLGESMRWLLAPI